MLGGIFLQVINMSYIASIVILFILVVRLLLAKAPKKYSYILWAVALVRLIVPISFESVLSLIPVNPMPVSNDVLYDISPNINTGMANIDQSISGSLPSADVIASVNPMQVWIFIGFLIWILGIAILLFYGMVSLIRMKGKLKNANYKKDNIYQSDNVTTPFVLGLIQPKIYLPDFLSESEKEYILLHEQTHIKRFDHVIRFISYLTLCLHWFNPLVWIAFWLSGKDMEMSCDESVINQLGHSVKKDYSQSLLNLTTGRMNIGLTPLAFGEGDAKGRIKNILNFKQPKFYIIVVAVMIIVVAAIGLISNPKTLEVEDKYTYNGETNINIDNRQFILEDVPKTLAEESVANVFLYSITAEFDRLSDVMSDKDSHRISIENQEKSFNDGNYIESYIIHEISTLSESEYNQNRLDDDELNPLYYYGWKEIIEEYNLTEYEVINAKFTQKHSEKSIALGPQIGDGTYSRSFIIGKSTNDNDYKIYDFGMITGNSSSERTFKDSGEVYKNEEYGFTLKIPDRWEGKYKIQESEGENYSRVSFLYTGYQYENGSFQEFFSIMIYDEKFFNESESKNEELILAKDEGNVFYYSAPLDSGIDNEEAAEEFTDLNINHVEVKELFRID